MSARDVERAIDAARRGWPVAIAGGDGSLIVRAVETATGDAPADALLISHARAATLRLTNQLAAARPAPVCLVGSWTPARALPVVDPQLDLANPLKGPFQSRELAAGEAGRAALTLARLAGLLPGWLLEDGGTEAEVHAAAIESYARPVEVRVAATARLPLAQAPDSRIVAFRTSDTGLDHVALRLGNADGPPLVRIHSECLTGDAFGSLKCDCGPQLHDAMARMTADGHGLLLYLRQEGRGIGLVNKLRAYQLQDQGFDTVDANVRMGFGVDERDYGVAAAMLRALGVASVRLLTNNPDKVAQLVAHGIEVVERVGLSVPSTVENAGYLATKRDRTGHQL